MAIEAATIFINVTTDADKASRDMQSLNGQLESAKKKGKSLAVEFIKGQLGADAIKNATKKAINYGKEIINLASDAEETQNKFNVVFNGIRKQAELSSNEIAKGYGLSSKASQQFLSDTGDLLTGLGFSAEEALNLSEKVTKLGVDLASFTNVEGGAERAVSALRSSLLGEREAVKALGIAISEADIKRLAEEKGIKGELDRQTKAALTLELALQQSKNAIGDFQRSQDSLANQSRILTSNIEDIGVSLGQKLIPFATSAVNIINNIFSGQSETQKNAQQLGNAVDQLSSNYNNYKSALQELENPLSRINDLERTALELEVEKSNLKIFESIQKINKAYDEKGKAQGKDFSQLKKIDSQIQALKVNLEVISERDYLTNTLKPIRGAEEQFLRASKQIKELELRFKTLQSTSITGQKEFNVEIEQFAKLYATGAVSLDKLNLLNDSLLQKVIARADIVREEAIREQELAKQTEKIQANKGQELKKEKELLNIRQRFLEIQASSGDISAQIELRKQQIDEELEVFKNGGELRKEAQKILNQDLIDIISEGFEKENELRLQQIETATTDTQTQTILDQARKRNEELLLISEEAGINTIDSEKALQLQLEEVRSSAFEREKELLEERRKANQEAFNRITTISNKSIDVFESVGRARDAIFASEIQSLEKSGATQEEIDKKKRQLAIQSAIQDKILGIARTGINTSIAVSEALASGPPPGNFILAGLVSAAGLAETVAIAATPIPQAQFGGNFQVPVGNSNDSALLRVSSGEQVSITPARESDTSSFSNESRNIVINIAGQTFDAVLEERLNSGNVYIYRTGIVDQKAVV